MAKKQVYQKVSVAQAVRDVLIASMNKGQFPVAILALLLLATIYKMPPEDVSKLVFLIFDNIINAKLIGWILAPTFVVLWFIHTRWQRRMLQSEIDRISLERNELQQKLLSGRITSSE